MNNSLISIFNLYKNLRSVQEIVGEILTMDYYVYNNDYEQSVLLIDQFVKKYNREIKLISSLRKDGIVVVDNDKTLYEEKDEVEVNSDAQYIRDCLIIVGAIRAGMRSDIRSVMEEIGWL